MCGMGVAAGAEILRAKRAPAPAAGAVGIATMDGCEIRERRVGAVTILDLYGELRTAGSRDALPSAARRAKGGIRYY